jgi:hypothetical protein
MRSYIEKVRRRAEGWKSRSGVGATACLLFLLMLSRLGSAGDVAIGSPFWCEDLGFVCRGDQAAIEYLAVTDPKQFLPEDMAAYVSRCQKLRDSGDWAGLTALKAASTFKGLLTDIYFVLKQDVRDAMLPASGARLVLDCVGRHLHVRGNLAGLNLHRRIYKAFENLKRLRAKNQLPRVSSARNASEVRVMSCDIAQSSVSLGDFSQSIWTFGPGDVQRMEISDVPRKYVQPICFASALGVTKGTNTAANLATSDLELQEGLLINDMHTCMSSCAGTATAIYYCQEACMKERTRLFGALMPQGEFAEYSARRARTETDEGRRRLFEFNEKLARNTLTAADASETLRWCGENVCSCAKVLSFTLSSYTVFDPASKELDPEVIPSFRKAVKQQQPRCTGLSSLEDISDHMSAYEFEWAKPRMTLGTAGVQR